MAIPMVLPMASTIEAGRPSYAKFIVIRIMIASDDTT
jgi:hypothetical protein